MRNKIIPIVFLIITNLLFTGVTLADGLPPLTHNLTSIDPPIAVPELRLKDMDDEIVDIKDYKGKVVVVNFWATWCPPCRREMPSLEKLYQATKDKGVVVLAVDIGEDPDTVFSFTGQLELAPTFPLLFDTDAITMEKWAVKGLPTTYVVSPKGEIVYRAVGGREFEHPDIIDKIVALNNAIDKNPDKKVVIK